MPGGPEEHDEDLMLRALVQLAESQNQRIEALRRAVVDLQSQLQARRDLEVLLAHEVRTPLTVVTGALHALQADVPAEARQDLARRALAQAEHLADVVDDLLEPRAAGAPMFPRARLREVRTVDLARQALDAVTTRHPSLRVATDVEDVVIATAPSRVVAVLVNLLENAAKYGGGDEPVTLTARLSPERDLVVEVADRGRGISADDPDRLFDAFTRGSGARNGDAPGRGVGLYLVRHLVRSLGGDVALAARPGGGTVARFHLPQRRAEDPAARATVLTRAGDASR